MNTSTELSDLRRAAPLSGLRIIEMAGLGPAPFGTTMLADLGADVVRVDRFEGLPAIDPQTDVLGRGRRSVALDLKTSAAVDVVLQLCATADVLIEPFRPGVAERLGFGPEACRSVNPRLVYARMSGWGQTGPYAPRAGHDVNYLAMAGALHSIGTSAGPPVPPVTMVGDFGGGGAFLAVGVLAAVLEARRTGRGADVDASIFDGVGLLMATMREGQVQGSWLDEREANMFDGGAPFYRVYECADGRYVALGAIEQKFWEEFLELIGRADDPVLRLRDDRDRWPEVRDRLAEIFREHPRSHWEDLAREKDACLTPVLTLGESLTDAHAVARGAFVEVDGMRQPAPAPRLSTYPAPALTPAPYPGQDTTEVLREIGVSNDGIEKLIKVGAARQATAGRLREVGL